MKKLVLTFLIVALSTAVFAAMPVPYEGKLDITKKDRKLETTVKSTDVKISVDRPIDTMKPIDFSFSIEDYEKVDRVRFSTNMDMNMGYFSKNMTSSNDTFNASMTLPKCPSGRTLWYGKLTVYYKDKSKDDLFFFYNIK